MKLQAANDSIITSNHIINNSVSGIDASNSSGTRISHNLFENNNYAVLMGAGTSGGTIVNNEFIDNNGAYPFEGQAIDIGTNNTWDDGVGQGNYWNNHDTRYPNASATINGTWDTPYEIEGFPKHEDRFPLINGSVPRVVSRTPGAACRPGILLAVTWNLRDLIGGGQFSIWENGTRVKPWNDWNGTMATVEHEFNKTLEATWDITVQFNNSRGVFGHPSTIRVVIDGTLPVITVSQPVNNSVQKSGTCIHLNITDVNIAAVRFNWNGGTNETLFSPFTVQFPQGDSTRVLNVFASDTAGNQASAIFTFTTDDTPPAISFERVDEGSIRIAITDTNQVVEVLISWNAGANQTLVGKGIVLIPAGGGLHVLHVHALDEAGNWETSTYEVFVDDPIGNIGSWTGPVVVSSVAGMAWIIMMQRKRRSGGENESRLA